MHRLVRMPITLRPEERFLVFLDPIMLRRLNVERD